MFGGFGVTELVIILIIVLLIFGPKRLKTIGSDLGNAIKGFRAAVTDDDKKEPPPVDPGAIEGEVNSKQNSNQAKQDTNV